MVAVQIVWKKSGTMYEFFHRLDLTGDRGLPKVEAKKLAAWWNSQPLFSCVLQKAGRYWRVFADKACYK